jgi:pyruvate kinase
VPRTRIVATLGPATSSESLIGLLVEAGVDVFRLNFSHGSHQTHGELIGRIRRAAGGRPVAILQDLGGPKLRLAHPVQGRPGEIVDLALPATVQPGDPVLLADGVMQLEVVDARRARVVVGGNIPAGKGLNLPSSRLDMPSLTAKDLADLRFGAERGVDLVAVSFVRAAKDLDAARGAGLPLIAKVETAAAVAHLDEIVRAADGVMVARGDLGVEIPIERVPIVQKELIALANRYAKPVITATQMLRSMVDSLLPTRAEASDVANAVLDGSDAVMLSEETAIGHHPVAAVEMMARILVQAEPLLRPRGDGGGSEVADVMARTACAVTAEVGAVAVVVPTRSGFTARLVARHRPRVPIVALTADESVRRRLSLVWGVTAITVPWLAGTEAAVLDRFRDSVRATGVVPAGSLVVVTGGWPTGRPAATNLVHVATI